MSDRRPGEPHVLETTRIGGGVSARAGAAVVAAILVVVVWVGISGRPTPTVPPSPRLALAQADSPSPSVGETTPVVPPAVPSNPAPTETPAPVAIPGAHDLSVIATLGTQQYRAVLVEAEEGHLSGMFEVPIPPPATQGTLDLVQVWTTVSHDAWAAVETWELRLESLSAASVREYVVLAKSVPARPTSWNVPTHLNRGYDITVRAQSGVVRGSVKVDVYLRAARQQIRGDDGILGCLAFQTCDSVVRDSWPAIGQIDPPRQQPLLPARAYNSQCRWDIGPVVAQPALGTDEPECRG